MPNVKISYKNNLSSYKQQHLWVIFKNWSKHRTNVPLTVILTNCTRGKLIDIGAGESALLMIEIGSPLEGVQLLTMEVPAKNYSKGWKFDTWFNWLKCIYFNIEHLSLNTFNASDSSTTCSTIINKIWVICERNALN